MDIIKRKINLKPFTERVFGSESFIPVGNEQNEKTLDGIVSDVLYEGTVLSGLAADAGFVPVAYGNRVCMTCGEDFCDEEVSCHWEEPEPVIRWDTLVRHYRFLVNFIVESDYYRIGYREDTPRLVKLGNDEEHVFWQLKDYFNNAIGVYSDISSAMEDDTVVNKENCTKIVVINQNTEEFFRLFPDGIDSEKDFMNFISKAELSEPPFVEIPITLFSDTKDMGMYEVYCDYWKPGEEYSKGCVVYHDDESGSTFAYMYKGDTPSSSEEFNYGEWEKLIVYDESGTTLDEVLVESKLSSLKRDMHSYDREGNELPYIETTGRTKEMPYKIGIPRNVSYEEDGCKYDVLKAIEYFLDDGSPQGEATRNVNFDNGKMQPNGIVKFTYIVGADDESGEGLVYEERRYYSISGRSGDNTGFIIVSDNSVDTPDGEIDSNKAYAIIKETYNGEPISKNPFVIKSDVHLDIHDAKLNYDSVNVVRGTSASYEAFNVLGEMNTIDDIEKYRDDWYRIKGKND